MKYYQKTFELNKERGQGLRKMNPTLAFTQEPKAIYFISLPPTEVLHNARRADIVRSSWIQYLPIEPPCLPSLMNME